ncbi:MAG TPA: methyltransferase domain-containing protein [Dokdonella sp.]|uniref:class I SAM-dependent methyltransferase n=1 Tax=Dokdonella sp. TaxID=2291710 RepID=UPI002D7FA63B|nr:methyltransferase domain-containing protein [Dokdonella sp.]HET9033447.1 methyltransferase domain-containing protein [Dokdonella sp.]
MEQILILFRCGSNLESMTLIILIMATKPKTQSMIPVNLSADEFAALLGEHGKTDDAYLARHYPRFASTLNEFCSGWQGDRGVKLLDVGAHWLHQSVLWQKAGFQVSALDLPATFEMVDVQSLAREMDIALINCADLQAADALDVIEDSSMHVILFTEIIEHLTFNPVRFWKQIHRILAPGGRIVVTTPNYYAWNGRAWNFFRFVRGLGGGISVENILRTHTYGHHWREFSAGELCRYFSLLSPDFKVVKAKRVRNFPYANARRGRGILSCVLETIPGLRPNLHLEIELSSKNHGIVIQPGW